MEGEAAETALAAAIAQKATWAGDPPYLIDLQDTPEGLVPLSFRERVRALGPTNKPEHGKQAEGSADIAALKHATGVARSTGRVNLIKRH
jgi:sulfite reductase (NADPH) hemoprotein beta-component